MHNPKRRGHAQGMLSPLAACMCSYLYLLMHTNLLEINSAFFCAATHTHIHIHSLLDMFSGPVPPRVAFMRYAIRSPRYGVEFGSSLLIILIALAFAIISPIIVLFGAAFFGAMWLFWR
jgi:Calcium-dependent channel, 7TM region, putative phosphate